MFFCFNDRGDLRQFLSGFDVIFSLTYSYYFAESVLAIIIRVIITVSATRAILSDNDSSSASKSPRAKTGTRFVLTRFVLTPVSCVDESLLFLHVHRFSVDYFVSRFGEK